MGSTAALMLPLPASDSAVRWFSARGCVVERDGRCEVFVGGTLVGEFGPEETGVRNVLLVGLAADPRAHLGRLAEAFGLTSETVRQMRRVYECDGIEPLWKRTRGGAHGKVTPAVRARLEKMFDAGASAKDARARMKRRPALSLRTIERARAAWLARLAPASPPTEFAMTSEQLALAPIANDVAIDREAPRDAATATSPISPQPPAVVGCDEETRGAHEAHETHETIDAAPVADGRVVQHVGAWLMLAMVERLGLHAHAAAIVSARVDDAALRVALDAVIIALSIGQCCVEGVRRLATPSAPVLLRATRAPSASWARRVLGLFSQEAGGARLHLGMAGGYIRAAATDRDAAPVVFYVDNHLRPYTGKHVVRRGWRMQDKRVKPGASDYYVHDEDGRPVLRIFAPEHGSLTDFLAPAARLLRMALGPEQKILLAFDRGGAFPKAMAELRDEGFEFVTYERRPYPLLAESAFDQTVEIEDEKLGVCETRTNLGLSRGRVRRIAVRHSDRRQVNLVGVSTQPAEWLIRVMAGRWNQENGFKHGVERWGVNQLDGRTVEHYAPETVVPNPARRRLDRALRIAKVREGDARRELSRLVANHPRRAHYQREIAEAIVQQQTLEALRPSTPKRAPLAETELAGKLVHHEREYKVTIDTIRIACANAESDLASDLARHMNRPREAKKALANLLAAPGQVRVGRSTIAVTLMPAGNKDERAAFAALLASVNGWNLRLPGDARKRRLRFRAQV